MLHCLELALAPRLFGTMECHLPCDIGHSPRGQVAAESRSDSHRITVADNKAHPNDGGHNTRGKLGQDVWCWGWLTSLPLVVDRLWPQIPAIHGPAFLHVPALPALFLNGEALTRTLQRACGAEIREKLSAEKRHWQRASLQMRSILLAHTYTMVSCSIMWSARFSLL
jgi:hypothetical protein